MPFMLPNVVKSRGCRGPTPEPGFAGLLGFLDPLRLRPLLLQSEPATKLLPVVQLRSGVILLMGDPVKGPRNTLLIRRSEFSEPEPGKDSGPL